MASSSTFLVAGLILTNLPMRSLALSGFSLASTPAISPVPTAPTRVHGQDVPLSQTAIDYYNKIGVDVSPSSNQTVSSTNSQNATSAAHNTGSYVGALGVASWLR